MAVYSAWVIPSLNQENSANIRAAGRLYLRTFQKP